MPTRNQIVLTFCIVALATQANAQRIFGVGTHLAQGLNSREEVASAMASLGATSIRDEILWDWVERKRGHVEIERIHSKLTRWISSTSVPSNDLYVFGYGNSLYDNGGRPLSVDAVEAYANFVSISSSSLKKKSEFIEVWNEWNLPTGRGIKKAGTSESYSALALSTVRNVRASGYPGKILVGGVGGDWPNWNFTKDVIERGAAKGADGYSIHLYNFSRNGTSFELTERLNRLVSWLNDRRGLVGGNAAIYVTEFGWPTLPAKHGLSEVDAATEVSNFLIDVVSIENVKGAWLYGLYDVKKPDPTDPEGNFGRFTVGLKPKEGNCKIKAAAELFSKAEKLTVIYKSRTLRFVTIELNGAQRAVLFGERSEVLKNIPSGLQRGVVDFCGIREISDVLRLAKGPFWIDDDAVQVLTGYLKKIGEVQ